MKTYEAFKAFIMRGNVLDLAVAVVIGVAFGSIVTSFVEDILMPPIGMLIGSVDFSDLVITLQEATAEAEAVTLNYGAFIQTLVDFLIIAFAIFMVIKAFERARKKKEEEEEAAPPVPSNEEKLLTEIRDLLKTK